MQQRNCRTYPPAAPLSGGTPGETIQPPAIPTPHSAWCQPQHCLAYPGMEATHRHLIGQVAGIEVWVERPDTTRPDGSHDYGNTAVYVFSEGTLPVTAADTDTLAALLETAHVFADDMQAVR